MIRDSDGEIGVFERGDVVWGIAPFKQDPSAESGSEMGIVSPRPWLVISDGGVPFHSEQYLCVTLTTRTWHDESIPLNASDWLDGGSPTETAILPWSVSALKHEYLDTTGSIVARLASITDDASTDRNPTNGYQGRLDSGVVDTVTRTLRSYLAATMDT